MERRSATTTYRANAIATGRTPVRMTTGVARREMNDYEELMTARTRRDSASLRRASGCYSDLRSLTVFSATGMRAAWPPERMRMICVASVKSNRGVRKDADEDAIIIERV